MYDFTTPLVLSLPEPKRGARLMAQRLLRSELQRL